jgi:hypothetical protein
MQFVSHRDPVATSGWGTALGATGDAINNILSIYGGYQKQKKMDAQQALENKWREDENRAREEERKRTQEMNDLNVELKRYDLERQVLKEGIPGSRPTVKTGEEVVDAAPDFRIDNKPEATKTDFSAEVKMPAVTAFGQATGQPPPSTQAGPFDMGPPTTLAGLLTQSLQPKPAFELDLKQPTKTQDVMGPAPTEQRTVRGIQYRGQEFAPSLAAPLRYEEEIKREQDDQARKKSGDIPYANLTDQQKDMRRLAPASAGLFEAQGWVPASILDNVIKAETTPVVKKAPTVQTIAGRDRQWDEVNGKWVDLGPHKPENTSGGVADNYGGLAGQDRLDEIRKKDARRAQLIEGMINGTVDPYKTSSLRGTDRANMIADAQLVDPSYNPADAGVRVKTRQDFATGDAAKNVRSINTAIKHIKTLDQAVQKLGPSGFPWVNRGINWFRSTTGDPAVARLKTAGMAVATEMAAALKGGRAAPTTQEINEQLQIISEVASPEQWRAVMETRADLLASRITSLEDQYSQVFGGRRPDRPLLFDETRKVLTDMGLTQYFREEETTTGTDGKKHKDPAGIR